MRPTTERQPGTSRGRSQLHGQNGSTRPQVHVGVQLFTTQSKIKRAATMVDGLQIDGPSGIGIHEAFIHVGLRSPAGGNGRRSPWGDRFQTRVASC